MISPRNIHTLARKYSTSPEFIANLLESIGYKETVNTLDMGPIDLHDTIRVNFIKTNRESVIKKLKKEKIKVIPIPEIPEALKVIKGRQKIGSSITYLTGEIMPQGLGSMLTVVALDPKPGETILDLAAAPGGKSCFIGERLRNKGYLYANDISTERLRSLYLNLARHGINNVLITNEDGSTIKINNIDKILLDAPCTGEGLLVSKPERRTNRTKYDIYQLQKTQISLLNNAINLLDSGGVCVYATCSLNFMENEEVVNHFLNKVQIKSINISGQEGNDKISSEFINARRLVPSLHKCDGFFIVKLEKL